MAIQNLISGDLKIRNENGILVAVDGIVFADTSGTIGTSGTSGTSGSSTILYGTSGSVIVMPGSPTTTTTAAPATTTTTVDGPYYYYIANQYTCPDCTTIVATGIVIKSFIAIAAGYWVEGLGSIMYNLTNTSAPNPSAITVNGNVATPTCPCAATTTTLAPTTTTTTAAATTTTTAAVPTTTTTTASVVPMILTFNVVNNGDSITLPYSNTGTYSGTVNWGDGNTTANSYANRTHVYAAAGNYDITINGVASIFNFNSNPTSKDNIKDIKQWGTVCSNYKYAFFNCSNLTGISATDAPYILDVEGMFQACTLLGTTTTNMNNWDLTTLTNTIISGMFSNCSNFNANISSWNTSNVTNMGGLFLLCSVFNQNINNWNVSNVTYFGQMFDNALAFNQNIGNWNVSSAINMNSMFMTASSFNQDLSNWNVGSVINMNNMFYGATVFNQDLSGWCVTNIPTTPTNFATAATAWVLPKPVWGTCP